MGQYWLVIWVVLVTASLVALGLVAIRLSRSAKRIGRSIDPIDQKLKALRLQVSALQHARTDRQRRLKKDNYSTTGKR